ncbi:MAG: probable phage integrase [Leptospirillum rubarum]|nr:MAG: probable phage integrase [Leptospirillum rubarum]
MNSGTIFLRDTKSGESRRLLMNSKVQEVLLALPGRDVPGAPVFTDTLGGAMEGRNLRRDFDHAIKKAGLAPFRFHDLRHTFASRLAMMGANDRTLQTLLGHKSQRMILRCAHLGPTHLWNAVEGLASSTKKRIGTDTKTDTGKISGKGGKSEIVENTGAGNGIRTRDPRLGKAFKSLFCCLLFFYNPLF